ncbi:MAG: hypothetical protein II655_12785 [Thermoguttaceae bacterium]|nr:hypothetical protein [Thermoguttaceae bacterium]
MKRREFISATLFGATAFCALGCGGAKKSPNGVVKFAGTATYGGQPIPAGFVITFTPAGGGRPSAAVVQANGEFYAKYSTVEDGVEHGKLAVLIGWDEEDNGPIPAGFEDLPKSYAVADDALSITVEKADTAYKLDFPKK